MGNNVNTARQHIETEFRRVQALNNTQPTRSYLVLEQVLQIQPLKGYSVDFSHLGTLFVLDKTKAGKFVEQDFYDFIQMCAQREAKFKQHDFQNQIQAYCTLRMWLEVGKPQGREAFVDWLCRLVEENTKTKAASKKGSTIRTSKREHVHRKKRKEPEQRVCNYETIEIMHQILNIKTSYGINSQNFFDLLRSFADEQSLYKGRTKANTRVVPMEVIQDFASHFIRGFADLMLELGFEANMSID